MTGGCESRRCASCCLWGGWVGWWAGWGGEKGLSRTGVTPANSSQILRTAAPHVLWHVLLSLPLLRTFGEGSGLARAGRTAVTCLPALGFAPGGSFTTLSHCSQRTAHLAHHVRSYADAAGHAPPCPSRHNPSRNAHNFASGAGPRPRAALVS